MVGATLQKIYVLVCCFISHSLTVAKYKLFGFKLSKSKIQNTSDEF